MSLDLASELAGKPRRHSALCAHCLQIEVHCGEAFVYDLPRVKECMGCTHPVEQILLASWPRSVTPAEAAAIVRQGESDLGALQHSAPISRSTIDA